MHAQAKSEKESDEKDDDNSASQALRRSNKGNIHNNGKQWASTTPKRTVSCWITDQG
jgi:hypothetical protein